MYASATDHTTDHWEQAYDEKYYNNLGIIYFTAVVKAADSPPQCIYKIWSPDVKNLMGSGNTVDEAKTDFWFHIMNRIYNREGGIYLSNSNMKIYNPSQQINRIKRDYKECDVELCPIDEDAFILIQPTIPLRQ